MAATTQSPKKVQRIKPKSYTTCFLYNTKDATLKLKGLAIATCNPDYGKFKADAQDEPADREIVTVSSAVSDSLPQLYVSDKMSCNHCDAQFANRLDQKRHYRSDWHRYNLKLKLKGRLGVSEEQFGDISGNISSLSGSDSDSDSDSDTDTGKDSRPRRVIGVASRLSQTSYSSTDSESETGNQVDEMARRLPKVYFKNESGELLSIYRVVICHKKRRLTKPEELISMATETPNQMNWAIFMAGGGHFAAAVFAKDQLIVHKTFHRYVVRAKRGTAQGSRDSQGNAPKSAGASIRRYNEAALTQEIQELIASWSEHIKTCDKIFLRAPSFNRKIFFASKNPPFAKDDSRIRFIPFQTRRPTFNEVRRVYEMLAAIECYGDEADIQDFIPLSPPQFFNPETGQLATRDESQLSPKQRKILNRKLRASPLTAGDNSKQDGEENKAKDGDGVSNMENTERKITALPDHVLDMDNQSSGTSTGSESELVEVMETINFLELKEFSASKKPKQKKKRVKKRNQVKCQTEPESNIMDEEKYHLKNNLYTACKVGDMTSLRDMLAIFNIQHLNAEIDTGQRSIDTATNESLSEPLSDKHLKQECERPIEAGQNENKLHNSVKNNKNVTFQIPDDIQDPSQDSVLEESDDVNTNSTVINTDSEIKDTTDSKQEPSTLTDTFETSLTDTACNSNSEMEKEKKEIEHTNNSAHSVPKELNIPTEHISKISDDSESRNLSRKVVDVPDMSPVVTAAILNETFGDSNTTLLHVAAKEGHKNIVVLLMEEGADPALRDKTGQTPYMVSKDKPTRNEFRRFMGKWPGKYDYDLAQVLYGISSFTGGERPQTVLTTVLQQIPAPLTEEQENERKKKEQERKKIAKKAKQERSKLQREENEKKEAEEREKKRYLSLSDREKRALAAERRLLTQASSQSQPSPVLSRCFQCGNDMTGKVPFEYSDYNFCSSKCLQAHRKAQVKS